MDKELLQKQIDEYRNDLKNTADNRDRMVGMVNQQEAKIQQLMGAIAALERIIREEGEKNVRTENADNPEGKVAN